MTSFTSSSRMSAAQVKAGESFGSIESVKAVSELFAPAAGEIVEVNPSLKDHPEYGQHAAARDVDGAAPPLGSERRRIAARRRGVRTPRVSLDAHDRRDRLVPPSTHRTIAGRARADAADDRRASLDELIDEAIPSSIRLQTPLNLPPPESEHQYLRRLAHLAHRNTTVPLLHRSRLSRHDHAERRPAAGDGEPGLVHAVHALSG